MPQFFLPPGALRENSFVLKGPEAFHIAKVLRRREGEALELFDGRGGRYQGKIVRIDGNGGVEGVLTAVLKEPGPVPRVRLELCQGLLKASRWDWLLEKGTELGIARFVPVATSRTVVLLKEEGRIESKLERWRRVVLAAAKQCGRPHLPEVAPPALLREALKAAEAAGPVLLAWEGLSGSSVRETLCAALEEARPEAQGGLVVSLFIGPEGGFRDEEVELAQLHGARLFGLGSGTLRAETAAIAAGALVLYELGAS